MGLSISCSNVGAQFIAPELMSPNTSTSRLIRNCICEILYLLSASVTDSKSFSPNNLQARRFVASNRSALWKLTSWFAPDVAHKPAYLITRWISLRFIGLIYLLAFAVEAGVLREPLLHLLMLMRGVEGRSKFGPLRRSKSRPVGEGVAVFVGRLERSLRSPFRAAQA